MARKVRELLRWQRGRCALTGRELTPQNVHADHIVPVSEGGTNDMENFQLVVAEANAAKGTMSNEAFIELCRAVARWHSGGEKP